MDKCSCGCWGDGGVFWKCSWGNSNRILGAIFYSFICTEGGLSEKKVCIMYRWDVNSEVSHFFYNYKNMLVFLFPDTDNLTLGRLYWYLGWCTCYLAFGTFGKLDILMFLWCSIGTLELGISFTYLSMTTCHWQVVISVKK